MSSQDGRNMDRPPPLGSVRRARERAVAGLPQDDNEPQIARPSMTAGGQGQVQIRVARPPFPTGLQTRDGQIGVAISKPTPAPQWPLQAPGLTAGSSSTEPYRPPPGRSQPPQRPPRPSRVPSILDSSKIQDHTPPFQYTARPPSVSQPGREFSGAELSSVPETPSSMSRPSTLSSVASIPDFPLPAQLQIPAGPPRRSVTLGPPPSARRGASSFYSNASFVSPIPEESPRSRSHTSFASSAAIPESWGTASPGPSPNYPDAYYDDIIAEESSPEMYVEDDAEESRLVRSASIGKRAKPTLVSAMTPRAPESRPTLASIQPRGEPFSDGTGYVENSSDSSTLPTAKTQTPAASATLTDAILNAYSSASATDPSTPSDVRGTPSPQLPPGGRPYSRLSAIRRPPRLDMDAVRKAESRGSMTSLPDLIRRATRLAASLERGRRPASRFEDFSGSEDYGREKEISIDSDKHKSGLSDMLAAFPPPAHAAASTSRRSFRDSIREQVQSWPLPLNLNRSIASAQDAVPGSDPSRSQSNAKPGRRCCGLPLWGFIVVMMVVLLLFAAAIVIPLEFLVIRKQNASNEAQAALQQCQSQLTCANGGTNVVNQGICSCLCANGFTGSDCSVQGTTGCTTISLAGSNAPKNVTVGNAIPRLLQQAQSNFSIPLSDTEILAKLNAGSLSCSAENALVTFDGRAVREGSAFSVVTDSSGPLNVANVINGVIFTTITIMAGDRTTITLPWVGSPTQSAGGAQDGDGAPAVSFGTTIAASSTFSTTITLRRPTSTSTPGYPTTDYPTSTSTVTTTMTMSSGEPIPTGTFAVTEEVLDFARVAVLFILQKETLSDAEAAQITLQKFFSSANPGSGATVAAARNITVGNSNSVNLVDFLVSTGGSDPPVGGRSRSRLKARTKLPQKRSRLTIVRDRG